MISSYGTKIAGIFEDIESFLSAELGFSPSFQPDPTVPGERFGICDYQSWDTIGDEQMEAEAIRFTLWIVASFESFRACRNGLIQLSADVRSLLPSIAHKIDRRGILLNLSVPPSVVATKRAPMTPPHTQTGHLWIGDIVVPMQASVAIAKSMCGEHL